MKQRKYDIRALCICAIMSAAGFVLMMLDFSVPFMPFFIKFDLSELPALITSFSFGPLWGILVCLLKNLIHLFFTNTAGVGEVSNFILGAIFVGVAGWIYQKNKTRKGALMGCLCGAAVMAILGVFTNYFIVYPIYGKMMMPLPAIFAAYQDIMPSINNLFEAVVIFNLPFNFAKGLADAIITFVIYKKLSPILKGRN